MKTILCLLFLGTMVVQGQWNQYPWWQEHQECRTQKSKTECFHLNLNCRCMWCHIEDVDSCGILPLWFTQPPMNCEITNACQEELNLINQMTDDIQTSVIALALYFGIAACGFTLLVVAYVSHSKEDPKLGKHTVSPQINRLVRYGIWIVMISFCFGVWYTWQAIAIQSERAPLIEKKKLVDPTFPLSYMKPIQD